MLAELTQHMQGCCGDALADAGEIILSGRAAPPAGYLRCDGAAVSRATYARLFTAIGVAFGPGDGVSTFNVPDARGRAPIGVGQGAGLTDRVLAAAVGEETHVLDATEIPPHSHAAGTLAVPLRTRASAAHGHAVDGAGGAAAPATGSDAPGGDTAGLSGATGADGGGGGAHNNMQPSLTLNFFIRY